MRRCVFACWLVVGLSLTGCAWLRSFYDDSKGASTASQVQNAVKDLPYGGIVSGIIGIGSFLLGGGTAHAVHRKKHKKKDAEIVSLKKQLPPNPPAAPAA